MVKPCKYCGFVAARQSDKNCPSKPKDERYNGWANYETWNVALWIGSDEGLYNLAQDCQTFERFKEAMQELGSEPIASMTPDKVAWTSFRVDTDEIEAMFKEDFRGDDDG